MQLYQALSPSILSQVNFAPAKLLIADFNADKLDSLSQNDYEILDPILQLISNSPMQSLKPAEEVWSCLHEHPSSWLVHVFQCLFTEAVSGNANVTATP